MKTIFITMLLIGCAFSSRAQVKHTVNSGNFYYTPATLTINLGDTVEWVNDGGTHNVNATTNTITGASFNNPESFTSNSTTGSILLTRKFTVAGTYNYDCSVGQHAANGMTGTIIVDPTPASIDEFSSSSISSFNLFLTNDRHLNITFGFTKEAQVGEISFYNLPGQYVSSQTIGVTTGANQHSIALDSNIPRGFYLVAVQIGEETIIKKFIFQ